jgi:hypothetical protein
MNLSHLEKISTASWRINRDKRCQVSGVSPAAGQKNGRSNRKRNFQEKCSNNEEFCGEIFIAKDCNTGDSSDHWKRIDITEKIN